MNHCIDCGHQVTLGQERERLEKALGEIDQL